jgi:hypothetical protein
MHGDGGEQVAVGGRQGRRPCRCRPQAAVLRGRDAAVARALVVTPGAVEKHVTNIFSKLDLPATDDDHRRVLAVLTFLRASGG